MYVVLVYPPGVGATETKIFRFNNDTLYTIIDNVLNIYITCVYLLIYNQTCSE